MLGATEICSKAGQGFHLPAARWLKKMRCTIGAHLWRCLQGQCAIAQLCWRFIPALSQMFQSCLVPNAAARMLALLLTATHSGHTIYPAPAIAYFTACYYFLFS